MEKNNINNVDLFGIELKKTLKQKYIISPFSVIDSGTNSFRNNNKRWIELGIKSEVGRDSIVYNGSSTKSKKELDKYRNNWSDGSNKFYNNLSSSNKGISIFSPFLCEIIYNWFGKDKCNILDPFAGGSVRGIVANYLEYKYTGIELRAEQCESNREQALNILEINNQPKWYCGDSDRILDELKDNYDLIFSCPPYFNLEIYSDLIDDISNMSYENFINKYTSIIKKSCDLLNKGGYAVFVLSDVRKKIKGGYSGGYVGLVKETINIFMNIGMEYYNDIILINNTGNAGIRADKYMKSGKIVRVHQNILVFKKNINNNATTYL